MSRYYFHLYNDIVACDEEGQELAGPDEARRIADCSARDMAASAVLDGKLNLDHRIEVEGEDHKVIYTVHFRDVVKIQA